MSTLQEKLKEYQSKGARELDDSFAPNVMLTNDEGVERYFEGKLASRSMVKTQNGLRPVYTAEYISSDCPIQIKVRKEWTDVPVAAGETVAFFAPTRLDRVLAKCKVGDQVVIGYTGREAKEKARGRTPAHLFVVQNLGGGTMPIANPADITAESAGGGEEF